MSKNFISIALVGASVFGTFAPMAHAGHVNGPQWDIERVDAYCTTQYWMPFRGGEPAIITVSGDFSTDLDLLVYDSAGNLIVSDMDQTDQCIVSFIPRWTQTYEVVVRNRGCVYNNYTLRTN